LNALEDPEMIILFLKLFFVHGPRSFCLELYGRPSLKSTRKAYP
jgi:hypothetical protein